VSAATLLLTCICLFGVVATAATLVIVLTSNHELARDNPRFDRERFLKAAGVQS
jgi:hypothetical protein